MKKILVPTALALGLVGAAHAQMTIYGLLDASYGKSLLGDVFLREKADLHSGGDNGSSEGNSTSRVGIKGSADVGSGVKANFKLETGGITSDGRIGSSGEVDPVTGKVVGDTPFFARQAWVGISGGLGEVRIGRQDSVSFQTMIDYDFNGASNGVSALGYTLVGPWLPGRQSRSIQYISPSLGGVTAQVGFVPEGNRGPDAKAVLSAGVKFATGPLSVAGSYQSKEEKGGKNFASAAGSFDFGFAKVMLGYANGGKFSEGGTGKGVSTGFIAPLGPVNVGLLYGQNSDKSLKLKSTEVFINAEVFKGTYAYAEAANWKTSLAVNPLDPAGKKKGTGYAVGLIYTF